MRLCVRGTDETALHSSCLSLGSPFRQVFPDLHTATAVREIVEMPCTHSALRKQCAKWVAVVVVVRLVLVFGHESIHRLAKDDTDRESV